MSEWNGRVAFITGGVSGLGLGIAQAFSDAGMRLALSYRNEDYRAAAARWEEQLLALRKSGNSVGAVIELVAEGVPAGARNSRCGRLDRSTTTRASVSSIGR